MRGTKLTAWRVPPIWKSIQTGGAAAPEGSKVLAEQKHLVKATEAAISAVFADARQGLRETVGVNCALAVDERCSIVLDLPNGADTEKIAGAIDLENVEAWRDETGRVHVCLSPWFSAKDVDQTVLSTVKVIHVPLGIHASDSAEMITFGQKIMLSVAEIMNIQKTTKK